ncbi:hypothetical protein BASA81_005075 [Batrachochytrium salamandrivorans]|nr:hypothetical protein BASA81_005075 [Batrachochytrium salamandrivorans]
MLVFPVIALLAIGSTFVSASNYAKFNLLKDDRGAGRLVWVNYDSKKTNYKSAADPFPTIKKLRENIKTVTDEEFNLGLTDAFIMTRDQHTHWTNTAPYGCFYATTGTLHPPPPFWEGLFQIKAGDELLAINGLSFVEWFKQNQFTSGAGANDFGGQRAALRYLTTIYGENNRLPSDDSINFKFKSRANPEIIYTVNVPYVSGRNEDCWNIGSNLYKSITSKTLPGTPEMSLPVSAEQPGPNHKLDYPTPLP